MSHSHLLPFVPVPGPNRRRQLAGLVLRAGPELERAAAAAAHRHGEAGQHPAGRGQPAGPQELPVLPPVHPAHLPAEALGGHAAGPGAAAQLCAGAPPAGGVFLSIASASSVPGHRVTDPWDKLKCIQMVRE